MANPRKPTINGLEILQRALYETHPERQAQLEQARMEAELGRKILALRERAGLTQAQLARRLGVSAAFIADLEEAAIETDYLLWLRRVATILHKRIEIRCLPLRRPLQPA